MKILRGKPCEISSSICSSPIGRLAITYCCQGLHGINQITPITEQSIFPEKNETIEVQSTTGIDPLPERCLQWLEDYFHSSKRCFSIPELCPNIISKSRSFQENVWHTLLHRVPFGQTITYAHLAELSGKKTAARAVGSAMRRNPFQLLVPCHRVIHSNGTLGNYAGGERNTVKFWLLKHEQN